MKKIVQISIWLLAFILTNSVFAQDFSHKTSNPKVQERLNAIIGEYKLPGLCFTRIDKNGSYQNYAVGFSDVENKTSMTVGNSFFSGSIGKTYAAALVMQMVEIKKMDLEDKFIHHFKETDWLLKLPNINDITIKMLLQHTSGLPRYVLKPVIWEQLQQNPDKVWTYEDRLSTIFNEKPVHEAGKGWAYSDTNYILLGMLIEKIAQDDYYDLIASNILTPYNLTETYPSLSREIPYLAVGYSKMPASFRIPNRTVVDGKYVFNPQMEWTGGGMASTASDLAKWAKIYYEGQLFSPETLLKMVTINPNGEKVMGSDSYGMGSFIYETKHGVAYGHSGFMPGFNSLCIYYPNSGISAAIQFNCDDAQQKLNVRALVDELITIEEGY